MGSETIEFIESRLEGKFQLEINREKTRVGTFGKTHPVPTVRSNALFGTVYSSICSDAASGRTTSRKESSGYSTWRSWG